MIEIKKEDTIREKRVLWQIRGDQKEFGMFS